MRPSKDSELNRNAIAVVGMAGRFPGAGSCDQLWQNLLNGVESINPISLDVWSKEVYAHPAFLQRPELVRFRPQLADADLFDAAFFGYSPREAQILDPQQRTFLECSWEALENAGYDSERFPGSIAVMAGVSMSTYLMNYVQFDRELSASVGNLKIGLGNMSDALATRVAYKLGLRGPACAVQSFCSTSLVAVHLACQGLLNHESDMALAGGVTISFPQNTGYHYQEGGIVSPDGKTRTFDAKGRGMVFGNGLGCVVLRRLTDAVRDGDNIRAVILGSAINNDGSVKVGFTAPSVTGQSEVVVEALSAADVDPDTIRYVEAHGTATALGDPAEVAGLSKAWRRWTPRKQYCAIGSVKTNIGHLDAAAGVAGLIKTVLTLESKEIAPSLHYESPNPQIDFEASPFYVAATRRPWPAEEGVPRRAGLSSFGIGGTNAHAILEEAPAQPPTDPAAPWQLLLLSAKTGTSLDQGAANLSAHLSRRAQINLADAAYTLQVGRRVFNHRLFAVVQDARDAVDALLDPTRRRGAVGDRQNAPVAFLFTGQGSQYVGMAQGLYDDQPVFRQALDTCAEVLREPLGLDFREVVYPKVRSVEAAAEELKQTRLTQPVLFAFEYALAQLWKSFGLTPHAMIGHSVGEYVAACLAGVFTLEDALKLVAERGRLMQSLPSGGMLAVPLDEAAVRPYLGPGLDLATINTPSASVVAGPHEAVAELARTLAGRGIAARLLQTSHAFHSAMMDPILPAFTETVAAVPRRAPSVPFVSNVSGTWITATEAQDPAYWARHLRSAVRFSDGVRTLLGQGNPVLLEVGPGNTLTSFVRQAAGEAKTAAIASVRHPKQERPDRAVLLEAVGELWLAGVSLDWSGLHAGARRRRTELPGYAFERQRYWVDVSDEVRDSQNVQRGYSLERQEVSNWFYQLCWSRYLPVAVAAGPVYPPAGSRWLVFADETGLGSALAEALKRDGQAVATVRPGRAFAALGGDAYEIHPGHRADYEALLRALPAPPTHVLHAWGVTAEDARPILDRLPEGHERGFLSLLFFAQALSRGDIKQPLQMTVVTSGAQDVTGGELTSPEKATATGPVRVIPQEMGNVACRLIDVDLPAGGAWSPRLLERLLAETLSGQTDALVAYRNDHRWIQSTEPTPLGPGGRTPLRTGGVYLITGGMGGIGLALARSLASQWKARLVLTGRSPLPPRDQWGALGESADAGLRQRIADVLDLEARGAEVLYVAADSAKRGDMERVVGAARERFGAIEGVVHSAGVAGGGIIPLKEPEVAARVLAPKVEGTLILDELTKDEPLAFFAVCSSIASLLGGFGQIDYTGANAFLDAFAAHARGRRRGLVTAINWDAWTEVGMAVNTHVTGPLATAREWNLKLGITPEEGVEAFHRILASGQTQLAVFTMDLRPGLAKSKFRRFVAPKEAASPPALAEAAATAALPTAVGDDIERLIAESWERVLGRTNIGPADNFFELGGDSLTALQAITILKARLGRDIPVTAFYEAPTVGRLAKALSTGAESAEKPAVLEEEVGQRAETRLDMMQRRRRPRPQVALDERR